MSQITNGHVAGNNNNNSSSSNSSSNEEGGKVSFAGRCQGVLIGAMERGCYRFGVLVVK